MNHSNKMLWAGRIASGLPILGLLVDASGKLMRLAPVIEGTVRLGYPESAVFGIGVAELVCVLLYAVPRSSVLGAIALTAFLGGATATHVRMGEPFVFPVLVATLVWAGLVLRDPRLRALVLVEPAARSL